MRGHVLCLQRTSGQLRQACALSPAPRHTQRARPHTRCTSCSAQAPTATIPINVQGKHLKVTDSIRDYCQAKIGHALSTFSQVINRRVEVRLSVRGGDAGKGAREQRVEVTVRTAHYGIVRAEEARDDLYAAIDVCCDKLTRIFRKVKEKAVAKGQWPGRGSAKGLSSLRDMEAEPYSDDDGEAEAAAYDYEPTDDEVEVAKSNLELPASIKRTKVFYLDAMSLDEAIGQLEQKDHDFYIYLDDDSGHVQVVYKRKHGDGHGVIITIPDNTMIQ